VGGGAGGRQTLLATTYTGTYYGSVGVIYYVCEIVNTHTPRTHGGFRIIHKFVRIEQSNIRISHYFIHWH
jgi:hypothetical protein